MVKPLFDVQDLRKAGLEEKLGKAIVQMSIDTSHPQRHSITGEFTVQFESGGKEKLFYKVYAPLAEQTEIPETDNDLNDLQNLFLREEAYLETISEKINPSLVPEKLGRLTSLDQKPPFFLFLRLLDGPSALEKYINLHHHYQNEEHKEELNQQRTVLLLADLKLIARFNGTCNLKREQFSPVWEKFMCQTYQSYEKALPSKIEYHLKRAVHWKWGGKEYAEGDKRSRYKFNSNKVLKRIKREKGLDLQGQLEKVFQERNGIVLNSSLELQHGDCRLQHNFNGRFCDLEDFGYHPPYRDVVAYMSEEITAPPVGELPALLAYYLIYEKAHSSAPSIFLPEELNAVDNFNVEYISQLIINRVGTPIFANFLVGYLAGIIEDDIRINGSRKKRSKESFAKLLPRYPNYTWDKLQRSRMKHIEEVYTLITSSQAATMFQYCSNQEGAVSYFFHMGKLLNDLGLTKIDHLENLERSRQGSQYSLFFAIPPVKKSA